MASSHLNIGPNSILFRISLALLPSGKQAVCYGTSPSLMGKSTISMGRVQ